MLGWVGINGLNCNDSTHVHIVATVNKSRDEQDAATYEASISDVCRFAKQSTGVQEQLPRSLKHGGDTRPWVSMFRRADSVEASYDALVKVLTERNRLSLIAKVNRSLNREIMEIVCWSNNN